MKAQYKNFMEKVSQTGSLMVEAMAMLALISLVTPTLYKKSAERTTELQDINTATHMRTIMKAVDNFVSANYESLLEGDLKNDGATKKISLVGEGAAEGIHDYFPYGYKFDELKNFGTPNVTLKRQGMSITSFVELPKQMDIGEMRAARIASMIGSNGGYVNGDKKAQGVGGIWSLNEGELTNLGFNGGKGSIIVASSEAINTASSGALENEKYLQRTRVEAADQLWRNTMVTDLYMGGVQDANEMYKILGVQQLILGDTQEGGVDASLIVRANGGQNMNGSAWIENTLSAMSDAFIVDGTAEAPVLSLASAHNDILHADGTTVAIHGTDAEFTRGNQVSFYNGKVVLSNPGEDTEVGAKFEVNTEITKELAVAGSTSVATQAGTEFKAGENGTYITANASNVNLLGNVVRLTKNNDNSSKTEISSTDTSISSDNVNISDNIRVVRGRAGDANGQGAIPSQTDIMSSTVNISGKTKVGAGVAAPADPNMDLQLNVQGNAFVSDTLEAGQIQTNKFKTLELHAGGSSYEDNKQWLNATADGVVVRAPETGNVRLQIMDGEETGLYNEKGKSGASSAVVLGSTEAQLRGEQRVNLYTTNTGGVVSLQNDALTLSGVAGEEDTNNTIGMNAANVTLNENKLQFLNVTPNSGGVDFSTATPTAVMELSDEYFSLSDISPKVRVLEVDLDSTQDTTTDSPSRGSVYIRRGAVEVDTPATASGIYQADSGYGYIKAGRFVSNAPLDTGAVAKPVENTDTKTDTGTVFDQYMVNPAYTSVMHDIKLTTRGGARLSDILPDFINKGIYVVNNTYKDTGFDIQKITVTDALGVSADGGTVEEISGGTLSGENQWASPFLGVVPTPICPPGYARVITITPAGFMMAQAGQMIKTAHPTGEKRWVVNEYSELQRLGKANVDSDSTVAGAQYTTKTIVDQAGSEQELYYLGHTTKPSATITENGLERPYSPQPLYFQQSSWLKSMVIPQAAGQKGACNSSVGGSQGCNNFVGWSTIMGFAYPGAFYKDIIKQITGNEASDDSIYWNVFPVRAQTLEAYATVYCYFDRTNLYGSGNNSTYVDPYDQLNKFHLGTTKKRGDNNEAYVKRLNDPSLKYTNPW